MKKTKILILSVMALSLVITIQVIAQNPKLSDPEVAHAAVTANQIDIDFAQIAVKKSKNADILHFAKTMADDHQAVIKQAVALATKLGVTPMDNAVSQQLLSDAENTKKMLRSKSAKDFDKAYIDNEVSYHKAVIAAVEKLLIPETENAELKELLENVVPALKTHLGHAEMVQSKFTAKY